MLFERKELIKKYIEFFKSKGHKEIPNASLVPANDPTVLFTTAGMHPLVPYLLGQPHPLGKRLVNVQRCIRTGDIDSVGDTSHLTWFEMLGNWSINDYFKEEAIELSFEFLTKVLKIPLDRLAITCFAGNKSASKDDESSKIWLSLGIPKERIAFVEDNWWETAGAGPCGPDTEMYYWKPNDTKAPKKFDPKDERWLEFWNDVLMQYVKDEKGNYKEASMKNIDTGMGLERMLALLNGKDSVYDTEVFFPIIKEIEKLSGKKYKGNEREMRIIADHIKASVFIIADDVLPSNTERGYVLRRLIRRAVKYGRFLGIENFTKKVAEPVFQIYDNYDTLKNKKRILEVLEAEEKKFNETLESGMREFEKLVSEKKSLCGKDAFLLYQSYGFPLEMVFELAKEKGIKVDEKECLKEQNKHQELSRTASSGQFKSGLADNSEITKKLHTATHLLNAALKIVLKDKNIHQKGSNITPERLRFDFNFPRKLTEQEIKETENLINKKIKEKIPVKREEMPLKKALESGAESEFGSKYPEIVSVYTVNNFTKEICTGPHAKNTGELGKFKIIKEESSAAGIRRIKAVLE